MNAWLRTTIRLACQRWRCSSVGAVSARPGNRFGRRSQSVAASFAVSGDSAMTRSPSSGLSIGLMLTFGLQPSSASACPWLPTVSSPRTAGGTALPALASRTTPSSRVATVGSSSRRAARNPESTVRHSVPVARRASAGAASGCGRARLQPGEAVTSARRGEARRDGDGRRRVDGAGRLRARAELAQRRRRQGRRVREPRRVEQSGDFRRRRGRGQRQHAIEIRRQPETGDALAHAFDRIAVLRRRKAQRRAGEIVAIGELTAPHEPEVRQPRQPLPLGVGRIGRIGERNERHQRPQTQQRFERLALRDEIRRRRTKRTNPRGQARRDRAPLVARHGRKDRDRRGVERFAGKREIDRRQRERVLDQRRQLVFRNDRKVRVDLRRESSSA